MRNVSLEKWRGKRDQVALDPAAVEFHAKPARSCKNCCFDEQWSKVCTKATEEAARRGMPQCDDGFVYVLVERDPRQLNMVEE